MQVMRLEKLVKLLEDQQDRAQAQRTRLEHRIAQLEVSLREKSNNNGNRYVVSRYNLPRSSRNTVDDITTLSRAFSCESRQALLETFRPVDPRSRRRSGFFARHRYRPGVSRPAKSLAPPGISGIGDESARFHADDWCRVFATDDAFVCERCRRGANGKFRIDNTIRPRDPIRRSLYGWLVGSSPLETFGEPTSGRNVLNVEPSSSENDADCLFRIVNGDGQDCSRESHRRRRRRRQCRRYRGRFSGSLRDVSPRRCNPIIRAT